MTSQRSLVQIHYRPPLSDLSSTCANENRASIIGNYLTNHDIPSEQVLHTLIAEAVSPEVQLKPLMGFKLDLSANRGFRKVFFSAHCGCGTAALMSVEVAEDKTMSEVMEALPALVGKLEDQARLFAGMPCEAHKSMRLGRLAGSQPKHSPSE